MAALLPVELGRSKTQEQRPVVGLGPTSPTRVGGGGGGQVPPLFGPRQSTVVSPVVPNAQAAQQQQQANPFGLPSLPFMPAAGLPQQPATQATQQGAAPQQTAMFSGELYKPLLDLAAENKKYRENLESGTGRIAGQIAGATGDWLAGMQNTAQLDAAQRGVGAGIESQLQTRARDTATRAGAKQLGDLAIQREAMLGGQIQGALSGVSAAPQLALQEKEAAVGAQTQANQAAQMNFQNQLATSNQAFNQYMALLNAQRQSPIYTGFSV